MSKKLNLANSIFIGLILGIIAGQLLYSPNWQTDQSLTEHPHSSILILFEFFGFKIFMGLLKMMIVPLIMVSVVVAVSSVGDVRKLGRLGGMTLLYYFSTMLIAVTTGIILVHYIEPGTLAQNIPDTIRIIDLDTIKENSAGGVLGVFQKLLQLIIPENIFSAMSAGNTLPLIMFSIFFAVVLTTLSQTARNVKELFDALYEIVMKMVQYVLYLAPVGVFCLLAWSVARVGLGVFGESIGMYMLTVLLGLAIHAFVTLPIIMGTFAKLNPFSFMHKMREALMTAIGTDSSSATLPVTIDCAVNKGDVDKEVAGLVLPLGATMNMDGTALYEAVAVIFMAQAYGIELGTLQYVVIALTATLAAVGAAAVPSAGLVTMVIVLEAVNQSILELNPSSAIIPMTAVGLIVGVDRILDMARTAVNVWGDLVGAKILSKIERSKAS